MKHFLDILNEKYNFTDEIARIAILFNSKLLYTDPYSLGPLHRRYTTLENVFNTELFSGWKGRLSCINIEDLKNALNIEYKSGGIPNIENDDDILKYLEYYINICTVFAKSPICSHYNKTGDYTILSENIFMLLDHMNYEIIAIPDKQSFKIVPKNPQGAAVAEISTPHTGLAILQYNHRALKGDLIGKSKILAAIANEYEDILKNAPDGHKELFDKTRGLCNQLCIRHTNSTNKCNVEKLSDTELEKWYDDLYQMLLLCVLINDNIKHKRTDRARELLASFNGK